MKPCSLSVTVTPSPRRYCWPAFLAALAAFLRAYLPGASAAAFLPNDEGQLAVLLRAYLLDKALYELSYELNNRPTWVPIPLEGILALIA